MAVTFPLFKRTDADELARFLASEEWPFHAGPSLTIEHARERIDRGGFDVGTHRTYWIVDDEMPVGVVRLDDLGDGTPLFDLRIAAVHRGRGIGTTAVRWMTDTVFGEFPDLRRIEATTRLDNIAMRRVLTRCGYVKEANYRQDWPAGSEDPISGERYFDSIGYAVLRSDWRLEKTTPVDWGDGS